MIARQLNVKIGISIPVKEAPTVLPNLHHAPRLADCRSGESVPVKVGYRV